MKQCQIACLNSMLKMYICYVGSKNRLQYQIFEIIFVHSKEHCCHQLSMIRCHNIYYLKCLFSTFNILLESKINISLCTDLIFTDHLFICLVN